MLEVLNLDLHYGAAIALRDVSLTVPSGRITTLLGRNGMGKTSLLRAIMGLHPQSRGTIRWEGEDISRLPPYERARRGIGYVPQGRDIFPLLTVEENLMTGLEGKGRRSIPSFVYELFPVLAGMRKRRGGDLSGGQQQQLAIARALVREPRLLLLDEPTEGIQPSVIKEIGRVIAALGREGRMAILLVEQYLDFARTLAHHFVVMERGSVVWAGGRDEVDDEAIRRRLAV